MAEIKFLLAGLIPDCSSATHKPHHQRIKILDDTYVSFVACQDPAVVYNRSNRQRWRCTRNPCRILNEFTNGYRSPFQKVVVNVELTIPWETWMLEELKRKFRKYKELIIGHEKERSRLCEAESWKFAGWPWRYFCWRLRSIWKWIKTAEKKPQNYTKEMDLRSLPTLRECDLPESRRKLIETKTRKSDDDDIIHAYNQWGEGTRSFFLLLGFRGGKVGHKLILVPYWIMLVTVTLGAMWSMLAFAKSPGTYTRWHCWLWLQLDPKV